MKGKKLLYIRNIFEITIIVGIIFSLKTSSTKINTYSSNENMNKNVKKTLNFSVILVRIYTSWVIHPSKTNSFKIRRN